MVRRLSLRCVRTWSVSSSRRTFSSSVPKNGSICPEMWTVRRIQLEEVPAVREVVRPGFTFTESFISDCNAFSDAVTTTLAQAEFGVKLRSCEQIWVGLRSGRYGVAAGEGDGDLGGAL